ncbi:LLM class flavin-dependent oxidoreductase [Hansschlegelia quercus]|uniref:LLM class flavin-dependent oxidoreductase n=1 Tax=Hansschlegelia quercus TaxID=2528245 RepID=A0A4V2JEH8_9HYPH|nr:LLM class flavin-dependent oxidoreductase [Hansschlegelia quercus]TBN55286.1 LLM class flavin-dependent oxidoreductase [Hansschlegelia quercus]
MRNGRLELGLDTFGDVTLGADGAPSSHAQVVREVVEQGVLADASGVDFFGVGEHHRDDFAISAPEVALAAIAARTSRIRLGSAVTVLSSDDPIRVFQRFSTLDAISGGRAEAILGRGSFTESFPLFGYKLDQYEALFEEKLEIFAKLRTGEPVTWSGATRPPLSEQRVYPTIERGALRTWVGVGGSPQSVVRAARHGLPMLLAIISGPARRFRAYVELYERAFAEMGRPAEAIGVHSPGYVADTDEAAREEFWPHYRVMRDRIGRERGWPPMSREEFEQEIAEGSLHVGAPETVARKIADTINALGLSRFHLKYSAGPLPHDRLMQCVELYGLKVAPMVRELTSRRAS